MQKVETVVKDLKEIIDLDLCQRELLEGSEPKYALQIDYVTNEITKTNGSTNVQLYGQQNYGNNTENNILTVSLKVLIKQSDCGRIYVGVTECNYNACKDTYIYNDNGNYCLKKNTQKKTKNKQNKKN